MPSRCFKLNWLSNASLFCTLYFGLCTLSAKPQGLLGSSGTTTKYKDQRTKTVFHNKKAATRAASRCSFCCWSFNDYHSLFFIKVRQHYFDDLALFRRHELADVIRLYRQFAVFVPAIDEHRQLPSSGPSEIDQLVERRAYRASGVKDVVDQDYSPAFDVAGQLRAANNWLGADCRKIVAIQSNVENADRRPLSFEVLDLVGYPNGQRHTAPANPYQDQISYAVILFDDFGSQTS